MTSITLKSTSDAAFTLRDPQVEMDALLDHILRNPCIPSPPTLALKIFQKTGQADCPVEEIIELLVLDAGLCSRILKTLNSAIYGRTRPVTSVQRAVIVLGNRPLRSLVMGLALPVMQLGLAADAGLRRFWKNSVAGAVLARELAARCSLPTPDDEMAASLLRDLGMIVLRQTFQDKYNPIWFNKLDVEQCDWEEQHLGINHAGVSAALLEHWHLPAEFREPIQYHHHPYLQPTPVQQLVDRTFLLDFVTRLTELEECAKSVTSMGGILQTARERYGLRREDLDKILWASRPKIEEFSTILGVDIGVCPDFAELLATGCEELVRVSLEAATSPGSKPETTKVKPDSLQASKNGIQSLFDEEGAVGFGSRILQYEVIEVIGRGAMGIVLKAFDPGLSRHVAIKLLAPELASSKKAHQRFALEARFAANLRHDNVVAIYAVNELDGMPFLVMEYVNGVSLGDHLDGGRVFSVAEIARIGQQTALGLAAAHEARLIHRDIKPANILIENGTLRVRVADFGLARAIDEDFHLSQPGLLLGTPKFMSPEQVDGKTLTAASDLFGLGSVLYVMCTGQLPFEAETMSGLLYAVAEKRPTPIRELNPNIPEELAYVIELLHMKKPADRPPSATLVAEALQPWCDSSTSSQSR